MIAICLTSWTGVPTAAVSISSHKMGRVINGRLNNIAEKAWSPSSPPKRAEDTSSETRPTSPLSVSSKIKSAETAGLSIALRRRLR